MRKRTDSKLSILPRPSRIAPGLLVLLLVVSFWSRATAQQDEVDELVRRTREVETRQLELLEALTPQKEQIQQRFQTFQELFQEGLVARIEFEEVRTQFEQIQERCSLEERRLQQSRQLRLEILASSGKPPEEASIVERSAGKPSWKLEDLPALSIFYQDRYGEALPISARGQTQLHSELGFDHRSAADLAVDPDSEAGQAILLYLRQQDIPYVAFRGAVEGSATGAHIHVGPLSSRLRER